MDFILGLAEIVLLKNIYNVIFVLINEYKKYITKYFSAQK